MSICIIGHILKSLPLRAFCHIIFYFMDKRSIIDFFFYYDSKLLWLFRNTSVDTGLLFTGQRFTKYSESYCFHMSCSLQWWDVASDLKLVMIGITSEWVRSVFSDTFITISETAQDQLPSPSLNMASKYNESRWGNGFGMSKIKCADSRICCKTSAGQNTFALSNGSREERSYWPICVSWLIIKTIHRILNLNKKKQKTKIYTYFITLRLSN